jgi:hypothetical protein
VHALYYLPIPALDVLRQRLTYDEFFSRVETLFPESDLRSRGLRAEHFAELLPRLGLNKRHASPSESALCGLLERHGAVMGAIGWFDRDVSDIDAIQSLRYWRQHAIDIIGATPDYFIVRDSLLPHPAQFTMAELDIMSLVVFVIEPAVPDPSAAIELFAKDSRAQS